MEDLRGQLIDAAEGAIDNVHDMDVTHHDYAVSVADAILELIKGAVKPLEWRIAHDHWAAGSPYGLYSVGDAGGGYAFVSIPCEGGVTTMRVYPFDMGKPVAEALAARASILAALGVE